MLLLDPDPRIHYPQLRIWIDKQLPTDPAATWTHLAIEKNMLLTGTVPVPCKSSNVIKY
jgi:hypothetical protein